jgi:hypothetical protein
VVVCSCCECCGGVLERGALAKLPLVMDGHAGRGAIDEAWRGAWHGHGHGQCAACGDGCVFLFLHRKPNRALPRRSSPCSRRAFDVSKLHVHLVQRKKKTSESSIVLSPNFWPAGQVNLRRAKSGRHVTSWTLALACDCGFGTQSTTLSSIRDAYNLVRFLFCFSCSCAPCHSSTPGLVGLDPRSMLVPAIRAYVRCITPRQERAWLRASVQRDP